MNKQEQILNLHNKNRSLARDVKDLEKVLELANMELADRTKSLEEAEAKIASLLVESKDQQEELRRYRNVLGFIHRLSNRALFPILDVLSPDPGWQDVIGVIVSESALNEVLPAVEAPARLTMEEVLEKIHEGENDSSRTRVCSV